MLQLSPLLQDCAVCILFLITDTYFDCACCFCSKPETCYPFLVPWHGPVLPSWSWFLMLKWHCIAEPNSKGFNDGPWLPSLTLSFVASGIVVWMSQQRGERRGQGLCLPLRDASGLWLSDLVGTVTRVEHHLLPPVLSGRRLRGGCRSGCVLVCVGLFVYPSFFWWGLTWVSYGKLGTWTGPMRSWSWKLLAMGYDIHFHGQSGRFSRLLSLSEYRVP